MRFEIESLALPQATIFIPYPSNSTQRASSCNRCRHPEDAGSPWQPHLHHVGRGVGPGIHLHGNNQAHILEEGCHHLEDGYWPWIPSFTNLTPASRKPSRIVPNLPTPSGFYPRSLISGEEEEGMRVVWEWGVSESSWDR